MAADRIRNGSGLDGPWTPRHGTIAGRLPDRLQARSQPLGEVRIADDRMTEDDQARSARLDSSPGHVEVVPLLAIHADFAEAQACLLPALPQGIALG